MRFPLVVLSPKISIKHVLTNFTRVKKITEKFQKLWIFWKREPKACSSQIQMLTSTCLLETVDKNTI